MTSILKRYNSITQELLDKNEHNSKKIQKTEEKKTTILTPEEQKLLNEMDINPRVIQENVESISSDSSGMLMGLVAKGVQDRYMNGDYRMFNARLQFLTGTHQFSYQKIPVRTSRGGNNKFSYTLERKCDLVNRLDIVVPNPNNLPLSKIIKTIETEVGGQRFDKIGCSNEDFDIETLIKTDCALFNRKISHINGKTFIPISLAPLYNHNMIPPSLEHHEFKINIEYAKEYQYTNDVEIYGNRYFLDNPERKNLFNNSHSYITIQHQYTGMEKMICGHTGFRLNFNHPVYLIYFWGFDKSKVKNITICLNGHNFYNGSAEALEHYKLSRGYDVEPMMFFFSEDDFDKPTKCTVNFSRIDSAQLYILSDQKEETNVHIVGLNLQPVRFMNGMAGLAFSK